MKYLSRLDLDEILVDLCKLVIDCQKKDSNRYGFVAAGILDKSGNLSISTSVNSNNVWIHAERMAIAKYKNKFGSLSPDSVVITTLSPCNSEMHDRFGTSCKNIIEVYGIKSVYVGYQDPTQISIDTNFLTIQTKNKGIIDLCKSFASTFL